VGMCDSLSSLSIQAGRSESLESIFYFYFFIFGPPTVSKSNPTFEALCGLTGFGVEIETTFYTASSSAALAFFFLDFFFLASSTYSSAFLISLASYSA